MIFAISSLATYRFIIARLFQAVSRMINVHRVDQVQCCIISLVNPSDFRCKDSRPGPNIVWLIL